MPLCTVAIPTYNREDLISGTIRSVLEQHLNDLEILVIDDQSQDNVFMVASSFSDPRLQVIRNDKNVGLFGNFNRCIELSRGKYLRILCNDDRITSDCLSREIAIMEAHPSVSLLFSKGARFTSDHQPLGEIGDHFPPTDNRWKGASSYVFLKHAVELVAAKGGQVINVDVTLICERPKIKPHRAAMRSRLAEILGVNLDQVSVKATTTEEMGFTGRSEGLAAQAVAAVELPR